MTPARQMLIDGTMEQPAEKPVALQADELRAMLQEMERQDGLLNFNQAATLLGVSRPRVYQLVAAGILKRYTFCGNHYVSAKETKERREADIKTGRPRRNIVETVKVGVKAALQTDRVQIKNGGYAGHTMKKRK